MFPMIFRYLPLVLIAALLGECLAADVTEPAAPAPLSDAAKRMTLPDGFRTTLFAGEPDVVQPIAMTTDERGRLWVVECLSYPTWQAKGEGRDRVVILEDRDGDGRFDSRKVFFDKGRNLTGIAIGFGGVWLCSAPELIFVPDRDRDDNPDGPVEVMLDGWSLDAKHNIVNGLTWGPDGWLYGCHGILADSKVGRPGAPDSKRAVLNCGVWRFSPTAKTFQVVAHGTTNPWGIAFNEYGQMFVANCVIKHLFHIIPGARYERMYGQDNNPYAFRLIESCADHIHWAGGYWKTEGAEHSQNELVGGGHAHSGAMIYLGDNWPDRYRNTFFTINIHGHRINNDSLEARGSGYVAKHQPDLLKANDAWFRGVSLVAGSDGGVYMSDWSDAGECHDYEDIHRENGRIYKITFGEPKQNSMDLFRLSDAELIRLQLHKNEWYASRARLLLQERKTNGKLEQSTLLALQKLFREQTDPVRQLRVLWAYVAVGGPISQKDVIELLSHPQEQVRAWTIRLIAPPLGNRVLRKFAELATKDPSPIVRLSLASALQRLAPAEYRPIAEGLAGHGEDSEDPNLPLLLWYGIESLVSTNNEAGVALLSKAQIPTIRAFITQRLGLRMALEPLAKVLEDSTDAGLQRDVVRGLFAALNGRREIAMPPNWQSAASKLNGHADPDVREKAVLLSLIFGDAQAEAKLRSRAADPAQPPSARQSALQALVQSKASGLVALLQSLVSDTALRAAAIRGLAAFEDPATPSLILKNYGTLTTEEKADAINTLASRPNYAVALLESVKQGSVPAKDVSPFAARQIQALKDDRIPKLLAGALGEIRAVSKDKAAEISKYKKLLTAEALKSANPSQGRALFNRTCTACHTLFDEGGKLAPELTGSQRSNVDYILENVIDPNAVVWNRYRATYFETADNRLISGVVLQENESTLTIQTQTGSVTLPRNEITSRHESTLSMMPEGLFDSLKPQEVLDLVAYLQSSKQVPLP